MWSCFGIFNYLVATILSTIATGHRPRRSDSSRRVIRYEVSENGRHRPPTVDYPTSVATLRSYNNYEDDEDFFSRGDESDYDYPEDFLRRRRRSRRMSPEGRSVDRSSRHFRGHHRQLTPLPAEDHEKIFGWGRFRRRTPTPAPVTRPVPVSAPKPSLTVPNYEIQDSGRNLLITPLYTGIQNEGQSCYAAAALQTLYNISPFLASVLEFDVDGVYATSIDNTRYDPLAILALQNVFTRLVVGASQGIPISVSPDFAKILEVMGYSPTRPDDSGGLISSIIDRTPISFRGSLKFDGYSSDDFECVYGGTYFQANCQGDLLDCFKKCARLRSLPEYLMLIISKDYEGVGGNMGYRFPIVTFQENMNVAPLLDQPGSRTDAVYTLNSIIVRRGAAHYVAYVKSNLVNTWYECNDSVCTQTRFRDVSSNQTNLRHATVFVYKRESGAVPAPVLIKKTVVALELARTNGFRGSIKGLKHPLLSSLLPAAGTVTPPFRYLYTTGCFPEGTDVGRIPSLNLLENGRLFFKSTEFIPFADEDTKISVLLQYLFRFNMMLKTAFASPEQHRSLVSNYIRSGIGQIVGVYPRPQMEIYEYLGLNRAAPLLTLMSDGLTRLARNVNQEVPALFRVDCGNEDILKCAARQSRRLQSDPYQMRFEITRNSVKQARLSFPSFLKPAQLLPLDDKRDPNYVLTFVLAFDSNGNTRTWQYDRFTNVWITCGAATCKGTTFASLETEAVQKAAAHLLYSSTADFNLADFAMVTDVALVRQQINDPNSFAKKAGDPDLQSHPKLRAALSQE